MVNFHCKVKNTTVSVHKRHTHTPQLFLRSSLCHTLVNKIEHLNHWGKTGSLLASIRVCIACHHQLLWPHCVSLHTVYLFTISVSSHLGFHSCSSLNCWQMLLMERTIDRPEKFVCTYRGHVLCFLFHLDISSHNA